MHAQNTDIRVYCIVLSTFHRLPALDSSRTQWEMVEGRLLQTRARWRNCPREVCLTKKQVGHQGVGDGVSVFEGKCEGRWVLGRKSLWVWMW